MRLIPEQARLPYVYATVQVANIVAALAYLILNWCAIGAGFVAADNSKYFFHLLLLPVIVYLLWTFFSSLSRHKNARLPVIAAALVASFSIFAAMTFYQGKNAFEHPSIETPPYPTDYWHSISAATDKGRNVGDIAISTYIIAKHDVKCYIDVMENVKVGPEGRDLQFFWDAGPAGLLGVFLSAYAFGIAGTAICGLVFLLIVCIAVARQARGVRSIKVPRDTAAMIITAPAAIVLFLAYIPLQQLSTAGVWAGEASPDKFVALIALFTALLALFLFALAWFVIRDLQIAKRIATFALFLVNLILPVLKLVFPKSLDWLEDLIVPGAPWLGPLAVAILVTIGNIACVMVLLNLRELGRGAMTLGEDQEKQDIEAGKKRLGKQLLEWLVEILFHR